MALIALDKETGKERWRAERNQGRGFSTPLLVPMPDGRVDLVLKRYSAEVHPETGERRMVTWDCDPETGEVIKTWADTALTRG